MLTLLAVALAMGQSDTLEVRCSSPGPVRTCHSYDGSTYIERVVGNRVIRQATGPDGQSWTEYVLTEAGGTRTIGQSSDGRTWARTCSPRAGTRGTDREGRAVYRAPQRLYASPATATDEAAAYAPCPDTVEEYDSQRETVRQLTAREIERRDRQRRQRRRGY